MQAMALTRIWTRKFDTWTAKSVKVTTCIPTALIVMKQSAISDLQSAQPLSQPPAAKSAAARGPPPPPDHEITGANNRRRSCQPRWHRHRHPLPNEQRPEAAALPRRRGADRCDLEGQSPTWRRRGWLGVDLFPESERSIHASRGRKGVTNACWADLALCAVRRSSYEKCRHRHPPNLVLW